MMLFAGNCPSSERSATRALEGIVPYSLIVMARLLWIEPGAERGILPRLGGRSTPFAAGCGLSRDALARRKPLKALKPIAWPRPERSTASLARMPRRRCAPMPRRCSLRRFDKLTQEAWQRLTTDAMAAKQLDRLADKLTPTEEQATRKRRLLKGPEQFRGVRVDRPKARGNERT